MFKINYLPEPDPEAVLKIVMWFMLMTVLNSEIQLTLLPAGAEGWTQTGA